MNNTKTKILNLAASLTQERGFGGFSYLDLADKIGIKAASIHYYFKSKDDLAAALVEYTHDLHKLAFQSIDANFELPKERLEEIIKHFQQYVVNNQFCLCGMLVAELHSVSDRVGSYLDVYFQDFQNWLAKQFRLMGHEKPNEIALCFLSTLEGALLLARVRNDPKVLQEALSSYLVS